jgi:hypothetical protein
MVKRKCLDCGKNFKDVNYKKEYGTAKRDYCNECVQERWKKRTLKILK